MEIKNPPRSQVNSEFYFNINREKITPQKKDLKGKPAFVDENGRVYFHASDKDYLTETVKNIMEPYDSKTHQFFWVKLSGSARDMPLVNETVYNKKYEIVQVSGTRYPNRVRKTGYVVCKGVSS
jgi:hypothetical protein